MGTFEMRSGSHVQLAALWNKDLELHTTSPFSNHGSVERSTACCRHSFLQFLLGFSKVPVFCVTLYYHLHTVTLSCMQISRRGLFEESKKNNLCSRLTTCSCQIPLSVNVLIMLFQAVPRGNHIFSVPDARHRFALFPWADHQTSEGKIFAPSQWQGGCSVHHLDNSELVLQYPHKDVRHDPVLPESDSILKKVCNLCYKDSLNAFPVMIYLFSCCV
jgi:hypothetical protein